MSRTADLDALHPLTVLPALPPVDWTQVGTAAPTPVELDYRGPTAALPAADVVVMTWTSAEWSALDHVFLASAETGLRPSYELLKEWNLYAVDVGATQTDNPGAPLWGYYQMVNATASDGRPLRVLLFKADAHLAHPPWLPGLIQMTKQVLAETGCGWIYSIGTAGASREDVRLGDVAVTNAGTLKLRCPDNLGGQIATGTSVTGKDFPATDLLDKIGPALFPMSSVVTEQALTSALAQLKVTDPDAAALGLADLVNGALDPTNLSSSRAIVTPGVPLLSTDYYFIATGDDSAQYAALEMDDAVIGWVAQQAGVPFTFVRNISDPVVPASTAAGQPISAKIRDDWSGEIYKQYGLYTSFNGAIVTWTALAG